MPSRIRAFLFLCVLLVGYQCFLFWQSLGNPLSPPARVASVASFLLQEGVILLLIWLIGVRRETVARWFLACWLVLRVVLPVALALRTAPWTEALGQMLTVAFWRNPALPALCLWAGAVYFVFGRTTQPWFARIPAPLAEASAAPSPVASDPGTGAGGDSAEG